MALSNEQWNAPSGSNFYEHQVSNSCRFKSATSDALSLTFGTSTDLSKFTFSCWVKRSLTYRHGQNTEWQNIIGNTTGVDGGGAAFGFESGGGTSGNINNRDRIAWYGLAGAGGGNNGGDDRIEGYFYDTSAWYHIVVRVDTGQNAATKIRYYVNGDIKVRTTTNEPTGNMSRFNTATAHYIGALANGNYDLDGYLAEVVFCDGQSLGPDSFAETKNGVWIPSNPSGLTFGNNGFYLNFADSSALGKDSSGNENDWTVVNLATHDQSLDSPTNNFCTINPMYAGDSLTSGVFGTVTEGNLKHSFTNSQDASLPCTHKTPASGKWYFEWAVIAGGGSASYSPSMGIIDPNVYTMADPGTNTAGLIAYTNYANKVRKNGTYVTTYNGSRASNGDVMGIAVDMDNGAFYVSKNGTYFADGDSTTGDPTSGSSKTGAGATWTPASEYTSGMVPISQVNGGNAGVINCNFGQDGTFQGTETAGGNADANGFGNFFTAPPTDYLAVCSANLSAAGADPAEEKQPINNYFQTLGYTGSGQNGRSLTTKLKAASYWAKNRTTGASTPTRWWNTTANNFGTGAELYVNFDNNSYGASSSTYQGVSNPQPTSITIGNVGYINVADSVYVGYLIGVAGASAVTDTSGDIDSVRFTDADAGISIMDYTGTGTSGHTVPHGLGVKPAYVIIKNSTDQNSTAWRVWSDAFGDANDYAVINTSAAWQTSGGIFTADPTTSVMALADDVTVNNANNTYMAWVFANSEGMVDAGTYVGNGDDGGNGTFVYTGFRPAFILVKKQAANNWRVQDVARSLYNPVFHMLVPNSNAAEDAHTDGTDYTDFLANGFKVATGGDPANFNADGATYIYLAFAEMPFKFATAR